MHEYSLVEALLDQVEAIRCGQAADRVVSVQVRIGEFSGVEPDLLEDAFEVLSGKRWQYPVKLVMERVVLQASCGDCHQTFVVNEYQFCCPLCESGDVQVIQGEELLLESLTLEQLLPEQRVANP